MKLEQNDIWSIYAFGILTTALAGSSLLFLLTNIYSTILFSATITIIAVNYDAQMNLDANPSAKTAVNIANFVGKIKKTGSSMCNLAASIAGYDLGLNEKEDFKIEPLRNIMLAASALVTGILSPYVLPYRATAVCTYIVLAGYSVSFYNHFDFLNISEISDPEEQFQAAYKVCVFNNNPYEQIADCIRSFANFVSS